MRWKSLPLLSMILSYKNEYLIESRCEFDAPTIICNKKMIHRLRSIALALMLTNFKSLWFSFAVNDITLRAPSRFEFLGELKETLSHVMTKCDSSRVNHFISFTLQTLRRQKHVKTRNVWNFKRIVKCLNDILVSLLHSASCWELSR